MTPGRTLHRLAARICSPTVLDRVVEPAIADLQKEYQHAEGAGVFSRCWILLAGDAVILKVVAIGASNISPESDERRSLARAAMLSVAMVACFLVLLLLPPLYSIERALRGWLVAASLIPQALPVAIPLGIAFGVALGLSSRLGVDAMKAVLAGALMASALNFAVLAWAMPAANQTFREVTFRELRSRGYDGPALNVPKGYNEMSLSELRGQAAHFAADGESRLARLFVFRFHFRFAFAAAGLVLVGLLLSTPVNHPAARSVFAFALCVAYWALMWAGDFGSRSGYLAPPMGAWLPNLVMVASAIFIASSSSSRLRGQRGVGH